MNEDLLIGYTRKSILYRGKSSQERDEIDADREHAVQVDAIKRFAGDRPLLLFSESDVARDKPIEECPELLKAIDACKEGSTFVFWRLDRLLAGAVKLELFMKAMERKGVKVLSLQEGYSFDWKDPRAVFQAELGASLAKMELGMIRLRTQEGLQMRRRKGLVAGTVPYGYRREGDQLHIDSRESSVLREIHRLRTDEKMTYREIADHLNKKQTLKRSGHPWDHSSVIRILQSQRRHIQDFPEHLRVLNLQ